MLGQEIGDAATASLTRYFRIWVVPNEPIIRTRVTDFWTVDTVDRYFTALEPLVSRERARHGRAKVLIDHRDGTPQTADMIERRLYWYGRVYRPGDASALVSNNALMRMQLKRCQPPERANMFDTIQDAETWLLAQ